MASPTFKVFKQTSIDQQENMKIKLNKMNELENMYSTNHDKDEEEKESKNSSPNN